MRTCKVMVLMLVLVGIFVTSGCSGDHGDGFLGTWQSDSYGMTITKDGDVFLVNVKRTSTWQGLQGKYTAKLKDGTLHFDMPMLGEARLSSDETTIYWTGDAWDKQ